MGGPGEKQGAGGQFEEQRVIGLGYGPHQPGREGFPVHGTGKSINRAQVAPGDAEFI